MSDTVRIAELVQLHVRGADMFLLLKTEEGGTLALRLPPNVDKEIVHIMADGLRSRSGSEFDPEAGHLLVQAHVQPPRVERAISPLGLQEKFVLEAQSEGATRVTMRLSESSVRNWIDGMERQLATKGKTPKQSS